MERGSGCETEGGMRVEGEGGSAADTRETERQYEHQRTEDRCEGRRVRAHFVKDQVLVKQDPGATSEPCGWETCERKGIDGEAAGGGSRRDEEEEETKVGGDEGRVR